MVKVLIRRTNGPGSRRKTWVSRVDCTDVDHARALFRKITAEPYSRVTKVSVWLTDSTVAVWSKGNGWTTSEVDANNHRVLAS